MPTRSAARARRIICDHKIDGNEASCRLCAFGKRVRDPKAYTMSLEEVWQRAGEGWSEAKGKACL
jgi:hypothetical protein